MSDKPGDRETLPSYLRDHETRLQRMERLPKGNGLPAGGVPGQAVVVGLDGESVWGDTLPPGGEPDDVLTRYQYTDEGDVAARWSGPIWWAWVGTEVEYDALGTWDDRVLYVIIQEVPGAVTDVTYDRVAHAP